jgi:hypothetical protein
MDTRRAFLRSFQDFVGTIAPFVRVAMALRDAVPVPPRLQLEPNETTGTEIVALQTSWVSLASHSVAQMRSKIKHDLSSCARFN